ncbi:MAG: GNAT family N-acetyltransferase [Desulfobacterales bacterium]|nr:GNAT family N-acetyltransferase [Desulfobacterales bacterium]
MPKLYLEEYKKSLSGTEVLIACREGVLRDHFDAIVHDVKFLERQGVHTTFLHNLPNRFANRKHFQRLEKKLPHTNIGRAPAEFGEDFYDFVLNYREKIAKIIILERKYLTDDKGRKINTLTTGKARGLIEKKKLSAYGRLVANVNFKNVFERICKKIEDGMVERVHILPAGRHKIKHELFSIEGSGTLIANNFGETLATIHTEDDVNIVLDILGSYKTQSFIKPRSKEYITENKGNFIIAKIDGIVVGCVEKIDLDENTIELGALAVSSRFRNQQIGFFLIKSFLEESIQKGCKRVISLTNNPKLQKIYLSSGFKARTPSDLQERKNQSPHVRMFVHPAIVDG